MRALLVCLALVSGCRTKECKDDTVLVDVTLPSAAGDADQLDVVVTVDGQTLRDRVLHTPGSPSGALQIEFPNGYPTGKSITVQVTAVRGGQAIASGDERITLSAACGKLAIVVDDVVVSDLAGSDLADMAVASDLSGDMTPVFNGQVTFADVTFNQSTATDAGAAQGRVLVAQPSFIQEGPHDYDDTVPFAGFRLGCVADHYVSPNKLPPDDLDDGVITLSGYNTSTGAPPTVTCTRSGGRYGCIFGGDAGVTPINLRVFPVATQLFPAGAMIRFQASGGTAFGSFDQTVTAMGTEPTIPGGVQSWRYSPTSDQVLLVSCPTCLGILVNIQASPNSVANFDAPSSTFGRMLCTFNASATMTIKKEAIAAMLGGDASLVTYRTTVLGGAPGTVVDSTGKTVALIPGRGQIGYSLR
jgi:hypothetical protein